MTEATGWSRAGVSSAMTLNFLAMGIAGFGWGALSDRLGARIVVLTGDGRLGRQTRQGLKDFQESRGLEPSGQLDPQTIAALGLDSDSSAAAGGSSPDAAQPAPERAAEPARGGSS